MPSLNFPSSPSNGQVYTAGGRIWIYSDSATSWINQTGVGAQGAQGLQGYLGSRGFDGYVGSAGRTYVSNTAPVGVASGETWYNTDTGKRYVYYTDVDSEQWVQESAPGPIGITGAQGAEATTAKVIAMAMIFGGF